MQIKKLSLAALSTLTFLGSALFMVNPAQASDVISGVGIGGGSARGTSTFLSTDPGFGFLPAYLIDTLKRGKYGTGVNMPAVGVGDGVLPNIGAIQRIQIDYEVANTGPGAEPNLSLFIKTADGIGRVATPTVANRIARFNTINVYRLSLTPQDFTPSFTSQRVLTASLRYNGAIGPIYVVNPIFFGTTGSTANFSFKTLPDAGFNN